MTDLYTHYFANSRHDGFVEAPSTAVGNPAWSRRIDSADPPNIGARCLLTCGENIIIDGHSKIVAFSSRGGRLWERNKWPGTQVVVKKELVYYTSAKQVDRFESVDMNNDIRQEGRHIDGVSDQDYLVMFEPSKEDIVAQVQYTSQPDEVTCEMMVYRDTDKNLGFDWALGFPGKQSPLIPLVCHDSKQVVTSIPGEALVFDLDAANNSIGLKKRFQFPLGDHTSWVSCGPDGTIYWCGGDSEGLKVTATSPDGKPVWQWCSGDDFDLHIIRTVPIAPPVVTPEFVYLLTPRNLIAIRRDKSTEFVQYNFESLRGEFYACTALEDGVVLLTTRDTITQLNEKGEVMFDYLFDEPIVTPPVVDSMGRVYVAGREMLHAIV